MTHRLVSLLTAAATVAGLCFFLPSPAPAATDGRLRVELLVDGATQREMTSRGTTYVEARRGRDYAIRLTNLEPVRVAVALAVDGRNTIDGRRTSARDGRKWILDPWQSVVISGWQTGDSRARRFTFTTTENSYAAWLGDSSNAGVIEAVAFRERQPEPPIAWSGGHDHREDELADDGWGRSRQKNAGDSSAAPAARAPSAGAASESGSVRAEAKARHEDRDEAATGMGREMRHDVRRIAFDHEPHAASSVRLRYEYRDALIALGVLPRHDDRKRFDRRERASGFNDSWCPEPPRY